MEGSRAVPRLRAAITRARAVVLLVAVAVVLAGSAAWLASRPARQPGGESPVISERLRQPEYHPELEEVVVANDTVTFHYRSDPGTLNYSVGDIIVGQTGFGYLRWVRDIRRSGNTGIVETGQASLGA